MFSQALHVLHTQIRMFGTFINVNAGGSAIFICENLLPKLAVVTHEITSQRRDHIVSIHIVIASW